MKSDRIANVNVEGSNPFARSIFSTNHLGNFIGVA